MRQKSVPVKEPAAQVVKNIRRATRRHFSAEDNIRIVLEGLRGEDSELCRREGIVQNGAADRRRHLHGGQEPVADDREGSDERRRRDRAPRRACVARGALSALRPKAPSWAGGRAGVGRPVAMARSSL